MPKLLDKILESKAWKVVSNVSTAWTFISVPVGAGVGIVLGLVHHHSLEWIFLWSGAGLVIGAVFAVFAHELWSRVGWGKPNIISTKAEITPLLYKDDHGYFIRRIDPPRSRLALVLEVINVADRKRKVHSIGKIRAQLTFRLEDWVRVFSPGMWVSEFFSSVDIGPGETRELILALSSGQMGDWRYASEQHTFSTRSVCGEVAG